MTAIITEINETTSIMIAVPPQEQPPQSFEDQTDEELHHILINTSSEADKDDEPVSASTHPEESSTPTVEVIRFGGSEDIEPTEESSELLSIGHDSGPSLDSNQGRSKWVKLRSTIKVACAFTPSTRKRQQLERQDSFMKRFSTRQAGSQYTEESVGGLEPETHHSKGTDERSLEKFVVNPDETFMFSWLAGLTCTVMYNLWTCIAREAFPEIRSGFEPLWFTADALCDLIYLLDIIVQLRTGYLERGLIVYDGVKLLKHYVYSKDFALDLLSLLPLDLVQIYVGIHPLLRFPRFIKAYRLCRFVYMVETRTAFPNMWRVANLSHVLFLGCHWFAAFYFLISKAEQFSTSWGYPLPEGEYASVTQKYLRSLYWSTLTLTTIGDLQSPESNWEFAFTITSYLIGVFVFATIVGQVGNIITNQNASRQEFERHLDGAKAYMRYHNVPRAMQQRVQRWYDYAWSRGRISGGGDINSLGLLPDKLKTELALHVNLETLKKVAIFHTCEPEFLHDLVLKMKAYIFTPRDLICRKGEVAREMFIIADGLVEVVSESGDVLKQMTAGDFFGEIGILNLDGGVNRRTADVRSLGYSELFVLSRDDVLAAFKDHPEAEFLIKEYGQRRLQELDEHKKRRLCERLAKELTTSSTEASSSTVGKMVLSTGLLHGIGLAASPASTDRTKSDKKLNDPRPSVMPRSRDLPNGNSRCHDSNQDTGDRWKNLLQMTFKRPGDSGSRKDGHASTCKEALGHASQGRRLFPVLRRRRDQPEPEISKPKTTKIVKVSEVTLQGQDVVAGKVEEFQEVRDTLISRRISGVFSKRKGIQPKPGKLWSLGLTAKGPPVAKLVNLQPTQAYPGTEVRFGTHSVPLDRSNNNAQRDKEPDGSISTHAQCGPSRVSPSGVIQSSNQPKPDGESLNRSNNSEDALPRNVNKTDRGSISFDVQPPLRLSEPLTPSTVKSDASPVRTHSDSGRMTCPDFQTICSDLSETIRDFVQRELMAMQAEYRGRLQRLEEEIAQKESTIIRLHEQLNCQNSTGHQ